MNLPKKEHPLQLIENISSFDKIRPEYQKLIGQLLALARSYFKDDFVAYYLLGSVGRGEDIPYVSDIDTIVIINRDATKKDIEWAFLIAQKEQINYKKLYRIDLGICSLNEIYDPQNQNLQLIFKTDGLLISGKEITKNFSSKPAGRELAKQLNKNYRNNLEIIRKDILEPEDDNKFNEENTSECIKCIAKKILRLSLRIIMTHENFYTRNLELMARKFAQIYPDYSSYIFSTWQQYQNPTNNISEALNFLDDLEKTIYVLADRVLREGNNQ